jgi:hypothetical protein
MSRSLKEIRNENKREGLLLNYKPQEVGCSDELIEQGKEEFERFIKPIRNRVYNRYLNDLYKLDEIAEGVFTDPNYQPELKNLKIRELIEYCDKNNLDISSIGEEILLKFTK